MNPSTRSLLFLLPLATLAACGTPAPTGEAPDMPVPAAETPTAAHPGPANSQEEAAWLARGAEITGPFKQELKAALMTAMADGPAMALDACRLQAPAMARRLSVDGIEVGRSSHKLRNPDNAPRAWVRPLLADYVNDAHPRTPRTVRLAANRMGYVEPISIQPPCLTCHGSTAPAAVTAALQQFYPEDQATGFSPDEFRGLFWVEFPLEVRP